ncbi:MAG: hypothetical protein C5B52_08200 [Bacteroidetes bacterium]|nr:MAG: hypothetical protein C5B52_08200 [Bacteroidota bacterium]
MMNMACGEGIKCTINDTSERKNRHKQSYKPKQFLFWVFRSFMLFLPSLKRDRQLVLAGFGEVDEWLKSAVC